MNTEIKEAFTRKAILQLLAQPAGDRRPVVKAISAGASISSLLSGLEGASSPSVREILCGDEYAANRMKAALEEITKS